MLKLNFLVKIKNGFLVTSLSSSLENTIPKLLTFQIGSQGQLLEWSEDFKEWQPTHRRPKIIGTVKIQ